MAFYDPLFNALGLRKWCDAGASDGPMTMSELLAKNQGKEQLDRAWYDIPFPSLDNLHQSCGRD